MDFLRLLLQYKANINVQTTNGNTPLHLAIEKSNNKNVVNTLLQCEPDLTKQNRSGDTCLHLAAMKGQQDVFRRLIDLGSDISLKNKNGKTAYDLACDASSGVSKDQNNYVNWLT